MHPMFKRALGGATALFLVAGGAVVASAHNGSDDSATAIAVQTRSGSPDADDRATDAQAEAAREQAELAQPVDQGDEATAEAAREQAEVAAEGPEVAGAEDNDVDEQQNEAADGQVGAERESSQPAPVSIKTQPVPVVADRSDDGGHDDSGQSGRD